MTRTTKTGLWEGPVEETSMYSGRPSARPSVHSCSRVLGETGGRAALPIWLDFMRPALAELPPRDFPAPPGVVFARIDAKTGALASGSSESTLFQAFLEGTEPSQAADTTAVSAESRRELELGF